MREVKHAIVDSKFDRKSNFWRIGVDRRNGDLRYNSRHLFVNLADILVIYDQQCELSTNWIRLLITGSHPPQNYYFGVLLELLGNNSLHGQEYSPHDQ